MINRDELLRLKEQLWKLQNNEEASDKEKFTILVHLAGHIVDLIDANNRFDVWCSAPEKKGIFKR